MKKCLTDKLVQLHHLTDGDIKIQKDVPSDAGVDGKARTRIQIIAFLRRFGKHSDRP